MSGGESTEQKLMAYEPWAVELAVLAREYCGQLAGAEEHEPGTLIRWLYAFWPLLYYKATRVPQLSLEELDEDLPPTLTELEYEQLRGTLASQFGDDDAIDLALSPEEHQVVGPEPTLSEVATDVYQELYDFLVHYRDGEPARMERALRQCHHYFLLSWGDKLLIAQRWLHCLRREWLGEANEGEEDE